MRVGITTGSDGAVGDVVGIFGDLDVGLRFEFVVDSVCLVPRCLVGVWSFSLKVWDGADE